MPQMEHELIALPEGVFTPVFLFVCSTFSFLFGRSLFVSLSFGHCIFALLLFMFSGYPFGIFKLFLCTMRLPVFHQCMMIHLF
jgi:hypothetical protein